MHPTREMRLNSLSDWRFSDLGTKQIKEVFDPLGQEPDKAKSYTARKISWLTKSQFCLMKLKLKSSGPGLFELSQLQTAFLISSSEKESTNISLSDSDIDLKNTLSNQTCGP